jgi:putative ABC transport system substrate-binding protein
MDVIVVGSNPATQVAKRATATISIVMAAASDPIGTGLVASLARPKGNVTGLAVLVNQANPVAPVFVKASQTAARTLGLQLVTARASGPGELDAAFAVLMREQPRALSLHNDPLFVPRELSSLGGLRGQDPERR